MWQSDARKKTARDSHTTFGMTSEGARRTVIARSKATWQSDARKKGARDSHATFGMTSEGARRNVIAKSKAMW